MWVYSMREGKRAGVAPRQLSGRGVSYWTDGKGDERIIYVTTGYRLVALNAKTGQPIDSFGTNGIVDLKVGAVHRHAAQQIDLETGEIGLHSTPTVAGDTVIVGSSFKEGMTVTTHNNTKGLVRAFDVRTGKLLWRFNTIPRPGRVRQRHVGERSWAYNGNTGVWTQITVDRRAGLVYLPVETPTSDLYGGHRPGQQPLCREPRRGRPEDRRAQVALPVRAPSDLGPRHVVGAAAGRRRRRRQAEQGRRGAEQAGLALRVRSHHRPADLADAGDAGAAVGRARREDLADAADSEQAAGLRAHVRARCPTT